ncbi:MAG: hypothetical protein QOH97_3488 [Actinoplanes sp.]|jgi:hypothetical protein|nr:hypothetical protein [Actinoplanes sp.]
MRGAVRVHELPLATKHADVNRYGVRLRSATGCRPPPLDQDQYLILLTNDRLCECKCLDGVCLVSYGS